MFHMILIESKNNVYENDGSKGGHNYRSWGNICVI